MDDSRLILAIGRIEQAMSRIERAARATEAASGGLAERHEELRRVTAAAVADLDRLLGTSG